MNESSDTPSIPPALTPEEWKNFATNRHGTSGGDVARDSRGRCVVDTDDGFSQTVREMHATAALCLYGQPFGFTREDVVLLRTIQLSERSSFGGGNRAALNQLADRIAALRPPVP